MEKPCRIPSAVLERRSLHTGLPRSEGRLAQAPVCDQTTPWNSASTATSAVIFGLIDQPTTSRLNRSRTIAKYSQPSSQPTLVRPDANQIGAPCLVRRCWLKVQVQRIGRHRQRVPASVVALNRRLWHALMPFSHIRRSTCPLLADKSRWRNSRTMRGLP